MFPNVVETNYSLSTFLRLLSRCIPLVACAISPDGEENSNVLGRAADIRDNKSGMLPIILGWHLRSQVSCSKKKGRVCNSGEGDS